MEGSTGEMERTINGEPSVTAYGDAAAVMVLGGDGDAKMVGMEDEDEEECEEDTTALLKNSRKVRPT